MEDKRLKTENPKGLPSAMFGQVMHQFLRRSIRLISEPNMRICINAQKHLPPLLTFKA